MMHWVHNTCGARGAGAASSAGHTTDHQSVMLLRMRDCTCMRASMQIKAMSALGDGQAAAAQAVAAWVAEARLAAAHPHLQGG